MKKAWSVVLIIVFIFVLLGATAIGVGYLTGGDDLEQIYLTMEDSSVATFIRTLLSYWDWCWSSAQQLATSVFG